GSRKDRRYVMQAHSLFDVTHDGCFFVKNPGDGVGQVALYLQSRNTPTLPGFACDSLHQAARDVVSIPAITLDGVTRCQPFPVFIEQPADQRTGHRFARLAIGPNRMDTHKFLSLVPYRTLDDRLMLAWIPLSPVSDLAEV